MLVHELVDGFDLKKIGKPLIPFLLTKYSSINIFLNIFSYMLSERDASTEWARIKSFCLREVNTKNAKWTQSPEIEGKINKFQKQRSFRW